ncbi:MAG: esterase-like activity of phytase family protein [Pseudomonadota bacterium]
MAGRVRQFLTSVVCGLALLVSSALADEDSYAPFDIDIKVEPFSDFEPRDPNRRDFGPLKFRFGAVLSSATDHFGGLSGMEMLDKGTRMLAISDTGYWLVADVLRDRRGRITGFQNARMAALYSGVGPRKVAAKYYSDAEGLALLGDDVFVSFESINVVARYRADLETLRMEPTVIDLPGEMATIDHNQGMEALVALPGESSLNGQLLTITERGESRLGPAFGWVLKADGENADTAKFFVERDGLYDVTDAALLADGDLLTLERKFTLGSGIGMRLRRLSSRAMTPGARVEGETLFEAGVAHRIDNMEALSVYKNERGDTVVAVLSDDNHSLLQRTILLEFVLKDQQ